jgi:CubicO group peptidase (beta-lactamase class C family)
MLLPADVLADGDYAIGAHADDDGAATKPQPPDAYDNAAARPSGYAFSSVYDLGKFAQFVLAGDPQVLPSEQWVAMQSPQINMQTAASYEHYGFGLFVQDFVYLADGWHSVRVVQHGGDVPGFACDLYTVPDSQFAIAVLSNATGAHFRDSIDFALKTYANLPPAIAVPSDVRPDPSTFASVAGEYQDDYLVGHITIKHDAGKLTISMPDLDAENVSYDPTLEPLARDVFGLLIEDYPLDITVIRDAAGKPEYLRERAFVAKRTMMITSPAEPVDAQRLRDTLRAKAPRTVSRQAASFRTASR